MVSLFDVDGAAKQVQNLLNENWQLTVEALEFALDSLEVLGGRTTS